MTLTREKFAALIQQLENYAQRNPTNYKIRVGLLAALGYAYIFLILAGLLVLLSLLVLLIVYLECKKRTPVFADRQGR